MTKVNISQQKRTQAFSVKSTSVYKVWFVSTEMNNKTYYVMEVNQDTNSVSWCSCKSNAMQFHTRSGIDNFVKVYLNKRSDIKYIHGYETQD